MPERAAAPGRGTIRVVESSLLRLAVTGTDTGVGKTMVACALVTALRTAGLRVGVMKPVETGVDARSVNTDAERLRRASGTLHLSDDVCPVTYAEPLAPLVAAERAGRPVDLARLDAARVRVEVGAGALVVEGAGGLLVPFARRVSGEIVDFAALAHRWNLGLVVVAANRLGAVNHTLLTVREAERRGLTVRAVVLNSVQPGPADLAAATNVGLLRDLLASVPVLVFPFVPSPLRDDPATLAQAGASLATALCT